MKQVINFLFPFIRKRAEADARIERHLNRLRKSQNTRPNWDDDWAL